MGQLCGFCQQRLIWNVEDQEWVHASTGDLHGPDGHYAEARTRPSWTWLVYVAIAVMIVAIVAGLWDLFN